MKTIIIKTIINNYCKSIIMTLYHAMKPSITISTKEASLMKTLSSVTLPTPMTSSRTNNCKIEEELRLLSCKNLWRSRTTTMPSQPATTWIAKPWMIIIIINMSYWSRDHLQIPRKSRRAIKR